MHFALADKYTQHTSCSQKEKQNTCRIHRKTYSLLHTDWKMVSGWH